MTAFIIYGIQLTWEGIIIALGCAAAVGAGAMLRRYQRKSLWEYFLCAILCIIMGVLGSRLMYWYCSPALYSSVLEALTVRDSGQSFGGAVLGIATAMLLLGIIRGFNRLPALFDCVCTAGMLAVFVGRTAGFLNSNDRGRMIFTTAFFQRFPFATELSIGGELTEWRFAAFFFEAVCGALIFVVCVSFFAHTYEIPAAENEGAPALMVCSMFGASQAILESTRYDSLFFHFNGFVSVVQIICAILLVISIISAFRRYIAICERRGGAVASLVLSILLIGCAGGLEYLVQRYAAYYPLWYSLMALALGIAAHLSCRTLRRCVDINRRLGLSSGATVGEGQNE